MSILTSRDERDQAKAKVVDSPVEQLQADLEYWSVAKVDHSAAYKLLINQQLAVGELYREADAWVDLIAEELHRRRHEDLRADAFGPPS